MSVNIGEAEVVAKEEAMSVLKHTDEVLKRTVKPLFSVMEKDEVKAVLKMRLNKSFDRFEMNPNASAWKVLEEAMMGWQYIVLHYRDAGETRVG